MGAIDEARKPIQDFPTTEQLRAIAARVDTLEAKVNADLYNALAERVAKLEVQKQKRVS